MSLLGLQRAESWCRCLIWYNEVKTLLEKKPDIPQQRNGMWCNYPVEYYAAIKNDDFMKFLGKWMELGNIIMSDITQSQKNRQDMHSLVSVY